MGKIRKIRAKTKPTAQAGESKMETAAIESSTPQLLQFLPKDADLESVRTFKSIKNKFGLVKHITKANKLKMKKEILNQKMDIIKLKSIKSSLLGDLSKKKSEKKDNMKDLNIIDKNTMLNNFLNGKIDNKKIVPDPQEIKHKNKVRGVEKKSKRKKQMVKDVNLLANLMFKK